MQLGVGSITDGTPLKGGLDVPLELDLVVDHELGHLLVERVVGVGLLLKGVRRISFFFPLTRNKVTRPKTTAPKFNTGIQSARKMLRQT